MATREVTLRRAPWRQAALAGLALAAIPAFAAASVINCGDTLTAGSWLLETDLVCPSNSGSGVGLTLTSGAVLDLGGHSIGMDVGGSGTAIAITGTGATVQNGAVTSADTAVHLSGGGGHHLRNLQVAKLLNTGIALSGSNGNEITGCQVNGVAVHGIFLDGSHWNRLEKLVVDDTSGIGPAAGIVLFGSNGNVITGSEVLRSQCTGIWLRVGSSRNVVCFNAVQDTAVFLGGPAVDILITDASSGNLVCKNQVTATATPAVTSDGINVGCKGGCNCGLGGAGFSLPTTGASQNIVLGNTADGELRYGIAQSTGNPGNVYPLNQATGNGTANFAIDP